MIKYLFLSLLALSCGIAIAQPALQWTQPTPIADGTTYGYTRPRIALKADNEPVVTWGKSGKVYATYHDSNGFAVPQQISPNTPNMYIQSWTGAEMAVANNHVFVVMKAQPIATGSIYMSHSADGGATYAPPQVIAQSTDVNYFLPAVAANDNYLAIMSMKHDDSWTNPRYTVMTSSDNGNTFSTDVDASENVTGEVCDCCPAAINFAPNGNIATLFRNNNNNLRDMWLTVSSDNALTFDAVADIDSADWVANECPSTGPDMVWNNENNLTATWMSEYNDVSRIFIAKSQWVNDDSIQLLFSRPLPISSTATRNFPRMAGNGDTLGLVWQEQSSMGMSIKFIYTTNGAESLFNAPIHTISDSTGGTRRNPDIAYQNGHFHFIWEDHPADAIFYRQANFDLSNSTSPLSFDDKTKVRVVPNPLLTNAWFYLPTVFKPNVQLTVSNVVGEKVYQSNYTAVNHQINLELGNIPKGLYFYQISDGIQTQSGKLLIEQ